MLATRCLRNVPEACHKARQGSRSIHTHFHHENHSKVQKTGGGGGQREAMPTRMASDNVSSETFMVTQEYCDECSPQASPQY